MHRVLTTVALCGLTSCAWEEGPHARVEVWVGLDAAHVTTDLEYTVDFDQAWLAVTNVELQAPSLSDVPEEDTHDPAAVAEETQAATSTTVGWIPGTTAVDLLAADPWLGAAPVPQGEVAGLTFHFEASDADDLLRGAVVILHGLVSRADDPAIDLWLRVTEGGALPELPVHLETRVGATAELHLTFNLGGIFDGVQFAELADEDGRIVTGPAAHPELADAVYQALLDPSAWSQEEHGHSHD